MGVLDHLTHLLRNLYVGQEATIRTTHGTTDWFKIGKGVRQGCISSDIQKKHPASLTSMQSTSCKNAGLDEAQAGIKIAGRNINNLRYADNTTLMAESEEELKSLLMRVKEESEKAGLKLNIQETKIMASGPITNRRGKNEFFFSLRSKITVNGDCSHVIQRCFLLGRNIMTNLLLLLLSHFSHVRLCATP